MQSSGLMFGAAAGVIGAFALWKNASSKKAKKDAKSEEKVKGMISTIDPNGWIAPHVHVEMYAENRRRLMDRMAEKKACDKAGIVLQGGVTLNKYDTDHEFTFRQESHFYYLFGCPEPECFGAIDLAARKSLLFIPRHDVQYAVWCGPLKPCEFYQQKYGVDACHYVDELPAVLQARGLTSIHILKGKNTDSGLEIPPVKFAGIEKFQVKTDVLYTELCECRVFKSKREIELMRYVNLVSSDAHVQVMREAHNCKSEHELESIFQYHTYRYAGCRHMSYTCICCSGENGAVLHYGHAGAPNDKPIQNGDMLLLDMGAEYHGYASDITCSYPANGKFTENQKIVFNAVREAQAAVYAAIKPGALWSELHRVAEAVILQHLIKHDFVRPAGCSVKDLAEVHHIGALFMPHGMGHLLGLDTHDVGGYPEHEAKRPDAPGVKKLRTNRKLKPGMVLTVEPGLYFIEALLLPALADPKVAKFLNADKIKQFMSFGGVRLEDDIVVTETGYENLTKCPRTVEEIESVMAGGPWHATAAVAATAGPKK